MNIQKVSKQCLHFRIYLILLPAHTMSNGEPTFFFSRFCNILIYTLLGSNPTCTNSIPVDMDTFPFVVSKLLHLCSGFCVCEWTNMCLEETLLQIIAGLFPSVCVEQGHQRMGMGFRCASPALAGTRPLCPWGAGGGKVLTYWSLLLSRWCCATAVLLGQGASM